MNVRKTFDATPETAVHGVEVNRDQTAFVAACEDGFRVYDAATCHLQTYRDMDGSLQFASILGQSNILALLGGHRGPAKDVAVGDVVIWDDSLNQIAASIGDGASIPLKVLITRNYFVPVCENGLALFKLGNEPEDFDDCFVQSYSTAPNPQAIAALGSRFLVFPGISTGRVTVLDLATRKTDIFRASDHPLRVIALSQDERFLATASDKGTIIRVWETASQTKLCEFRRGSDEAEMFSLAFSPSSAFLACTSDKGTLHIFDMPGNHQEPLSPQYGNEKRPVRFADNNSIRSANRRSISGKTTSEAPSSTYSPAPKPKPTPPPASPRPTKTERRATSPDDFMTDSMHESMIFDDPYFPSMTTKSTSLGVSRHPTVQHKHSHSDSMPRASPSTSPLPTPTPGTEPNWAPVMQQKTTRFADIPPSASSQQKQAPSMHSQASGPDYMSLVGGGYPGQRPRAGSGHANAAVRGLGAVMDMIPKAMQPRVWTDTKSVMKAEFHLPGRARNLAGPTTPTSGNRPGSSGGASLASLSSAVSAVSAATSATVTGAAATAMPRWSRQTLAQGAPPKGQIAWVAPYEVVVVSAGRGGRWEKYVVEMTMDGRRMLRRIGWKNYMDDDGQ